MAKLVLISRLAVLVAVALLSIYYVFRQEIRTDLTYAIRLGLHLLLVASVASLFVAPVIEFRARQVYGLVVDSSGHGVVRPQDPIKSLVFPPRLVVLVPGALAVVIGSLWAVLIKDDKLTNVPGMMSGAGAFVCLVGSFGL